MGLSNCSECGKLYVENSFNLCVDCLRLQEAEELKVVAYLRDVVDHASVFEIHEATGVKQRIIMKMIQQGRVVGGTVIFYPCESCGAQIKQGRLCPDCSHNILSQIPAKGNKQEQEDAKRHVTRFYTKDKL
jgi:ribosomal protein L32